MRTAALTLLAIALPLVPGLHASDCRAVRVSSYQAQSSYQVGTAYQSHAFGYYAPVYYPAFTVGYAPAPEQPSLKEELLGLKVEFYQLKNQQLQQQIQQQAKIQQAQQQVAEGPRYLAVLQQHCARCHDESKADREKVADPKKAAGGGFVLLRGGLTDHLSPDEKLEVRRRVGQWYRTPPGEDRMPPDAAPPDADVLEILTGL